MEAFCRRLVVVCCQEEVVVRILSSQRMELDLVACQVDIGADEAVAPQGAQFEGASQHRGRTGVAGDAHEDPVISVVVQMLETTPRAKPEAIADNLSAVISMVWKVSSKRRVGNALRRWAAWLIEGRRTGRVPDVSHVPNFRRKAFRKGMTERSPFPEDESLVPSGE